MHYFNLRTRVNSLRAINPLDTLEHRPTLDIMALHKSNPRSVFQAASQFNCLEFPSQYSFPEQGVTAYASDPTQGPACALACAAGTIFRNYFALVRTPDKNQVGQTKEHQINNMDDLESELDNEKHGYWRIENGYTFSNEASLIRLRALLESRYSDSAERDTLMGRIKIGVHANVGVTFESRFEPLPDEPDIRVTQCYCSALSCAYSGVHNQYWELFAKLVLDAS